MSSQLPIHQTQPDTHGDPQNRLMRYGVVAVVAMALMALTGWFVQGRTLAQDAQTQVEPASLALTSSSTESAASGVNASTLAPAPAAVALVAVESSASAHKSKLPNVEAALARVAPRALEVVSRAAPALSNPAQASQVSVVRSGGAELLDGPNGRLLITLPTGTSVTALGRSDDGAWIYVQTEEEGAGWTDANQVLLISAERLSVIDVETAAVDSPQTDTSQADTSQTDTSQTDTVESAVEESGGAANSGQSNRAVPSDASMIAAVTLTDGRLNIRSGPGGNYPIVGKALPGEQYAALARNEAATWVQIELPNAAQQVAAQQIAWVSADFVAVSGADSDLPVSDVTGSAPVAAASSPVATGNAAVANAPAAAQAAPTGAAVSGLNGNLIFQGGNGGPIYVYNLETGALRMLTNGHDPAISPDGRTVAFTRYGGAHGLYLIELDGSNERMIFGERELIGAPSWSPDGQWILFSHLTGQYGCREVFPGLCFANNPFLGGFPLVEKAEWGLSKVDRNGEEYRDLPALNTAYAADWTDSGIVYQATTGIEVTYDTPEYEGYAVFNQKVGYQDPDWRPGGGRIVFQDKGNNHTEIWSTNADGSGLMPLTGPETTLVDQLPSNVAPAWSPDGQHIVYLSNRDAEEEAGAWRLWVMDADGGNKRPLPIESAIEYNYGREQVVSWGPSS